MTIQVRLPRKMRFVGMIATALLVGTAVFAGVGSNSSGIVRSATAATAEQAQGLLDQAVAKLEKEGPQAAFTAFNDRKGSFVNGELYVFAFDLHGIYQASGGNPGLVGLNAIDLKDAEGKALVREMIAVANSKGSGTVDYVWLNRATNKVEKKHSLVKKSGEYIVGVGYYQ